MPRKEKKGSISKQRKNEECSYSPAQFTNPSKRLKLFLKVLTNFPTACSSFEKRKKKKVELTIYISEVNE